MKTALLLLSVFALPFASPAQTVLTGTPNWTVVSSQFAPDPSTCRELLNVGSIYIRTQDPNNGPIAVLRCAQTGANKFTWQPIDHLVMTALPSKCTLGDLAYQTGSPAGLYACAAANTWQLVNSSGNSDWVTQVTSKPFVDARSFGLDIQAAINASSNGQLVFPAGAYLCSGLTWGTSVNVQVIIQSGADLTGCSLPLGDASHWVKRDYGLQLFSDLSAAGPSPQYSGGRQYFGFKTGALDPASGASAGFWNTGFGFTSLESCGVSGTDECNKNTAFGFEALRRNTTGRANTAIGMDSSSQVTTGVQNVSVGADALFSESTGSDNVAIGVHALLSQSAVVGNVAVGYDSVFSNVSAGGIVGVGFNACHGATLDNNTCIGFNAGYTSGAVSDNTYVGTAAGFNSNVHSGTAVGSASQYFNTSGFNNTSLGTRSLFHNVTGTNQVAVGYEALMYSDPAGTSGSNVAIGSTSLHETTSGVDNLAIGYHAGFSNTTGSYNIFLGSGSGYFNTTGSHQFIAGGARITSDYISDVYFGSGVLDDIPQSYAIHGTGNNSVSPNGPGGDITLAGGASTGNAIGGSVIVTATPSGSSGTSTNPPVTIATFSPTSVSISIGGSANKAICWKSDGKTLGYCSTQPDSSGACTCN